MADIGDNSGSVTVAELRSFVERIERVEDAIAMSREDLKEVYWEAKGRGYDAKTLRKVVSRRKRDRKAVAEEDAILDMYESALGVFA